jgi:hypothetical protein
MTTCERSFVSCHGGYGKGHTVVLMVHLLPHRSSLCTDDTFSERSLDLVDILMMWITGERVNYRPRTVKTKIRGSAWGRGVGLSEGTEHFGQPLLLLHFLAYLFYQYRIGISKATAEGSHAVFCIGKICF